MPSHLPIPSEPNPPTLDGFAGRSPTHSDEPPPVTEQGIKRYLAAFVRYKWMILLILAVGTGVGLAVSSRQMPIYEARARVWIGSGLAGGETGAPIRQGELLHPRGWRQLLTSSAVLDSVVRQRRLYIDVERPADTVAFGNFLLARRARPGRYSLVTDHSRGTFVLSDGSGLVVQRGRLGEPIGRQLGFRTHAGDTSVPGWLPATVSLPRDRPLEFTVRPPQDVVLSLAQRLQSSDPNDNSFMNITFRGEDPEEIQSVLAAIVDRFAAVSLELKKRRLEEQAKILNEQLAAMEEALTLAESELETFKVRTITLPSERAMPINPGLQQTDNSALASYWRLTTEKDQITRDRESILRALQQPTENGSLITALEIVPSVQRSTELNSALKEAASADATIRAMKVQYTDLHPQVAAQQELLDSLQNHVIPAYARQLVQELSTLDSELTSLVGSTGRQLQQIPERSIREMQLTRRVEIAGDLYRDLETRTQNAEIAEMITVPDMEIVDRPSTPFVPVEDPRSRMLLMFVGGSFGLALLGAVLRDRMDPRLRYPTEVTGGMGLFILGAVPALRRGKMGATDMALAVESFRAIQLSLLHAHGGATPLVATVTSPGASDGKSFVTSNLAIAFADMGHRTLVIDGDVRRGTVHQLLGTRHKPGLTDYLAGRARLDEALQSTRYPLLEVIGCGSRAEGGPKLLGSAAMSSLMERLRDEYDIILVDSPPLGACVDPMILGTLTGNLVLVLRTGTTDRNMAESKLQILDRLPVRVLGAVLNDVPSRGPYRYYSYISGYEVLDDGAAQLESGSAEAGRTDAGAPAPQDEVRA